MKTYCKGKRIGAIYRDGKEIEAIFSKGQMIYEKPIRYGLVSNGAEYINTGIVNNITLADDFEWEMKYKTTEFLATPLQGCGTGNAFVYMGNYSNRKPRVRFGSAALTSSETANIPSAVLNRWYVLKLKYTASTQTVEYSIDGMAVWSNEVTEKTTGYSFFLFLLNPISSGYFCKGALEYSRYKKNGVLLGDFVAVPEGNTDWSDIPAPSNCLWDNVSGKYFENAGTGAFDIEEAEVNTMQIAGMSVSDIKVMDKDGNILAIITDNGIETAEGISVTMDEETEEIIEEEELEND